MFDLSSITCKPSSLAYKNVAACLQDTHMHASVFFADSSVFDFLFSIVVSLQFLKLTRSVTLVFRGIIPPAEIVILTHLHVHEP